MALGGIPEVMLVEEKVAPSARRSLELRGSRGSVGAWGEPRVLEGKAGQRCGSELMGLGLTGGVEGDRGEHTPAWESSVAL